MEDKELLIEDNESCFELRLEDLNEDVEVVDEDFVWSGTLEKEYSSGIDRKFVSFSHFDRSSSPFELSSSSLLDLESRPETNGYFETRSSN